MAASRLGIFALVIFLSFLTRTYSHRPIILRFHEVNKILWSNRLLIVLPVFVSLWVYNNIFVNNYLFLPMHSNVTIKNVSWFHFSWATLYMYSSLVIVFLCVILLLIAMSCQCPCVRLSHSIKRDYLLTYLLNGTPQNILVYAPSKLAVTGVHC